MKVYHVATVFGEEMLLSITEVSNGHYLGEVLYAETGIEEIDYPPLPYEAQELNEMDKEELIWPERAMSGACSCDFYSVVLAKGCQCGGS